jgi:hypothetical protein
MKWGEKGREGDEKNGRGKGRCVRDKETDRDRESMKRGERCKERVSE